MVQNEYEHFLDSVYAWGDATWMDQCFDLLKRMFTALGINSESSQLGMTVGKKHQLNVNIGQRYVLAPWGNKKVGLILPLAVDEISQGCELHGYFRRNKTQDAKFVLYEWSPGTTFPGSLYHQWEQACADELKRSKKSAYRKFHSGLFFDTVMNNELREKGVCGYLQACRMNGCTVLRDSRH